MIKLILKAHKNNGAIIYDDNGIIALQMLIHRNCFTECDSK
jgi:hypothetical protein